MTQRGAKVSVTLDGPQGPRAGDVLAAALGLALATRREVRWRLPMESEQGPAWSLVAAVAGATGAEVETSGGELRFTPVPLRSGRYGLTCSPGVPVALALEALWWPLALAQGASDLDVFGETHAAGSPSFHDFAYGVMPAYERQGGGGELALESAGFPPEGGGHVRARVFPAPRLRGLDLPNRGMLREVRAVALVANLGIGIALPMERRLSERLRLRGIAGQVEMLPMPAARGRGLAVVVAAEFEHARAAFTAVGEAGRPGHEVVDRAVDDLVRLLERRGAVDARLAGRMLVGAALAASVFGAPGAIANARERRPSSRFTVGEVTGELLAVARVARALCDVEVQVQGLPGEEGVVEVRPPSA